MVNQQQTKIIPKKYLAGRAFVIERSPEEGGVVVEEVIVSGKKGTVDKDQRPLAALNCLGRFLFK